MQNESGGPSGVIAVILGGGAGTRLFPLTKERAKPAVPLAGKYRLVDIPISNCINSGMRRIFLLTQFNSSSLHRHIQQSYRFDEFSRGFVEIMAAEQTPGNPDWYQGTADAVRQNLVHFAYHPHDTVVILSGDQLYRMDFRQVLRQHEETDSDLTVAVLPVPRSAASGLGILQIGQDHRIVEFVEKPGADALDPLRFETGRDGGEDQFLASMGIYIFRRGVMEEALASTHADFGRDIIPRLIHSHRVWAYVFRGYWEDIGTIRAFFDANLNLVEPVPAFNFFDVQSPIYTHARYLPASKVTRAEVERAVIAEGCIITEARIERSLVGVRSRIGSGAMLRECIVMGQDWYESEEQALAAESAGIPRMGIGAGANIERAIVDKNARIGRNVRISPEGKPANLDGDCWYIRDGIVLIPKNATVPDGTVI